MYIYIYIYIYKYTLEPRHCLNNQYSLAAFLFMLEAFLINLASFRIYWHGCPCSQVAFPLDNLLRSCLQRQIDTGYKASAVLWDKDGLKLFL